MLIDVEKENKPWSIALVSEQYAPDAGSTAQLFDELLKQFSAKGAAVRVCTMTPGYVAAAPKVPWRETRNGAKIWRAPRLPFARTNRKGEALNWIWGMISMGVMALFTPRHIPLLIGTNPPMAHLIGGLVKVLKGQRYIGLFYDLHPELSCAVGMLQRGSLVDRVWRRLNMWALRHADYAVCLGEYMERTVQERWPAARTVIIPNWCDSNIVHVLPKSESKFVQQHQLHDKFVVLFSGNMGWRQRLEILLEVAERLLETSARFVFIGEGAKKSKLMEAAKSRGLHNVLFFPYQPREQMEHSLAAADVAVVSQEREVIGCGVPSKIYAYMASGRAILGLASQPCEVADLIHDVGCGWNFNEDGNAEIMAGKLRQLMRTPSEVIKAGRRARQYFEQHFTLQIAATKYEELIKELNRIGPAPSFFTQLLSPQRPHQVNYGDETPLFKAPAYKNEQVNGRTAMEAKSRTTAPA